MRSSDVRGHSADDDVDVDQRCAQFEPPHVDAEPVPEVQKRLSPCVIAGDDRHVIDPELGEADDRCGRSAARTQDGGPADVIVPVPEGRAECAGHPVDVGVVGPPARGGPYQRVRRPDEFGSRGADVGELQGRELARHGHRNADPLGPESPNQRRQFGCTALDALIGPVGQPERGVRGQVQLRRT